MAVFKPTDCVPFDESFDLDKLNDPIFFECKIDTSNTKIAAYCIEIYDENEKRIFPTDDIPFSRRVSSISDLKRLTVDRDGIFHQYYAGKANINNGLNGSILSIPAIVKSEVRSKIQNTVARNMLTRDNFPKTVSASYRWRIALYQDVTFSQQSAIRPMNNYAYDMTIGNGQVLGSTNKRIQTKPIDTTVSLIDKYIQPIYVENFNYDADNPVVVGEKINYHPCDRVLISDYDPINGIIYPYSVGNYVLDENTITPDKANAFVVYKNGNSSDNLSASDLISLVVETPIVDGENATEKRKRIWSWVSLASNPANSYWEESYTVSKKNDAYYPIDDSLYIPDEESVLLNHMMKESVVVGNKYLGSPYNGVFVPKYDIKEEDGVFNVTVQWRRRSDCATWGKLLSKVLYIDGRVYGDGSIQPGQNVQINLENTGGEINKVPFMFVAEKPIDLYSVNSEGSLRTVTRRAPLVDGYAAIRMTPSDSTRISSVKSITANGAKVPSTDYCVDKDSGYIFINISKYERPVMISGEIYVTSATAANAGVIFYNSDNRVYIRHTSEVEQDMRVFFPAKSTYVDLDKLNKEYWFLTGDFSNIEEGDKYIITSFYRFSDYNPFKFNTTPNVTLYYEYIDDPKHERLPALTTFHTHRNIRFSCDYNQIEYIQWRSYQFLLYSTDENYVNGVVVKQKDQTYDGEIFFDVYGLDNHQHYKLLLYVYAYNGVEISREYDFYTTFEEKTYDDFPISVSLDCPNHAAIFKTNGVNALIVPETDRKYENDTKEMPFLKNSDFWVANGTNIPIDDSFVLSWRQDELTGNFDACTEAAWKKSQGKIDVYGRIDYAQVLNDATVTLNRTSKPAEKFSEEPYSGIDMDDESFVIESKHALHMDNVNIYEGDIFGVTGYTGDYDKKDIDGKSFTSGTEFLTNLKTYLPDFLEGDGRMVYPAEDRDSVICKYWTTGFNTTSADFKLKISVAGASPKETFVNPEDYISINDIQPSSYTGVSSNKINVIPSDIVFLDGRTKSELTILRGDHNSDEILRPFGAMVDYEKIVDKDGVEINVLGINNVEEPIYVPVTNRSVWTDKIPVVKDVVSYADGSAVTKNVLLPFDYTWRDDDRLNIVAYAEGETGLVSVDVFNKKEVSTSFDYTNAEESASEHMMSQKAVDITYPERAILNNLDLVFKVKVGVEESGVPSFRVDKTNSILYIS